MLRRFMVYTSTTLNESAPDRDFLVISRTIDRSLHEDLTVLMKDRVHEKCTLFLTTLGGSADAAYRIARCLRHHYNHVRVVIPSFCKSSGTLILIAANEIAIGDLGELGPLDVQVYKATELAERGSGLDIVAALEAVRSHTQHSFKRAMLDIRSWSRLSTKMAGEFAAKIAVGIAGPLYAQIDPNRLGEMNRKMRVAYEYGLRLDEYCSNLKEDALDRLVGYYPSHAFVIDRKEAKELFREVCIPNDQEYAFIDSMREVVLEERDFGPEFIAPAGTGEPNVEAEPGSHEAHVGDTPEGGNGGG
jgi:hypothetical protein